MKATETPQTLDNDAEAEKAKAVREAMVKACRAAGASLREFTEALEKVLKRKPEIAAVRSFAKAMAARKTGGNP